MIKKILVVGGGSAGWLTAGLIAARYKNSDSSVNVYLVESPNIATIGVGEGTWPTMVNTLKRLGISEREFIRTCHASFKQASKFQKWVDGSPGDHYYHPFSMPQGFEEINLVPQWQRQHQSDSFANTVCLQASLCDEYKAPKPIDSQDYAMVENHGYHLDAGKFTRMLTEHCVEKLNVVHLQADVIGVNSLPNGDIASLNTEQLGELTADLFIDCSGTTGLLIDKHYQIPFISKKDVLFIDKALAVQIPYRDPEQEVASATISTAQTAGWIWDIGLSNRRGVGHVYSSKYTDKATATQELIDYLGDDIADPSALTFKELDINPGYRAKFWHNNCVAVGMASGFLEPLEASALVMVEMAANTIAAHLPASREGMDVVAKQYNRIFTFRWERIIDFLKLHYVLSKREDSQFWLDNRDPNTIPESLQELLTLWRYQSPSNNGYLSPYDLFPAASYQYILYGMGFETLPCHLDSSQAQLNYAEQQIQKVQQRKSKILAKMPTNRALLTSINGPIQSQANTGKHILKLNSEQLEEAAKHHPIFFTLQGENVEAVALLGLEAGEILTPPMFKASQPEQPLSEQRQSVIKDCMEPVKLDIKLNNGKDILIDQLFVLNQGKMQQKKMSIQLKQTLEQLHNSLHFVPQLIAAKNHLDATKH